MDRAGPGRAAHSHRLHLEQFDERETPREGAITLEECLPLDWLEQFPKRIAEVTPEQVHDAVRRRIDPDRLATVVVGAAPAGSSPR